MSLASTQNDIDTAYADLVADIHAAQATYFSTYGKYWQGRISHSRIPADGNSVSADLTTDQPTDQDQDWVDFLGVNAPGSLPAACYVHVYKKPNGSHGYRIQKLFIYSSQAYSQVTDSGTDPTNTVAWGSTPDAVVPEISAPTYTSVDVSSGGTAGGTAITITGTGFQSGATVTVGGASATSVTVVSGTSITCTTPAGTAGAKDIVITNIDSKSATGSGAFTYTAASAPAFVQYDTDTASGSSSMTLTLPVAPTSGNLLVMVLRSNSGVEWSGFSGWTQLSGGGTGQHVYYKISNGTETSISPDDDGAAKADNKEGLILEISGNNATPLDTSAVSSNTMTTPSVTTSVDNCLVLSCGMSDDDSVDYQTQPTGWTLVGRAVHGTTKPLVAVAYKAFASAGATGTADWDAGTYASAYVWTVAFKP